MNNEILTQLYNIIKDRKINPQEDSYTSYLFNKGLDKILKKCGEECSEVIIASKNNNKDEISNEICDLLYHLMVLMNQIDIPLEDIYKILEERSQKIGNLKPVHQSNKNS
jgi:phosphoribosyl-ATP pyrophosphohydrolase